MTADFDTPTSNSSPRPNPWAQAEPIPSMYSYNDLLLTFTYGSQGNRYGSADTTLEIKVDYPMKEVVVFNINDGSQSTEYYANFLKHKYYARATSRRSEK